MFKAIPEEHRKKFYIIFGILCVIAAISGGTLAWYTWQSSNNTTVSFTVGGVDVTFDAGSDITSSKLRPVSTKEVGVEKGYAIEKTITASSPVTAYLNLYLTLETLPNGLKHESFIWEIYKDNALVDKGNFKDVDQGDKITIASNQKIRSTTSTYKLYIWIDGENYGNPETMQNQAFKFVLNADASDEKPFTGADYIESLLASNPETMNNDDPDGNVRYMGADPNNYLSFNNELWRIIGVFEVNFDYGGEIEKRIKIIRDETIGGIAWNRDESDWTNASLQEYLNGEYYNTLVTEAKNLVEDAVWNLGGVSYYGDATNGLASHFYGYERGTTLCADYPTYWIGKIGLMYPSDYGYATSGGATTNREYCLAYQLINWNNSSYSDCKNNDYLYDQISTQWTITSNAGACGSAFRIFETGAVNTGLIPWGHYVRPVVFLNSMVQITSGTGTIEDPFEIGL